MSTKGDYCIIIAVQNSVMAVPHFCNNNLDAAQNKPFLFMKQHRISIQKGGKCRNLITMFEYNADTGSLMLPNVGYHK